MEPSGRNRWQPVAKCETPENRSIRPIGNRWQPTATVSQRMVKVDHLLAKEGVTSLAPQREVESRVPEGAQDSTRNLTGGSRPGPAVDALAVRLSSSGQVC